jgi:hypothetical protein
MADENKVEAYIAKNAEDIVRTMKSLAPEQSLYIFEINFKKERFGNPHSRFLRTDIGYRLGNGDSTAAKQDLQFYAQYFNGNNAAIQETPETASISPEPLDLKYLVYDLFKSSGLTPMPYRFPRLPNAVVLSSEGDMMLEERLVGLPPKERAKLNENCGEVLLGFQRHIPTILQQIVSNKKVIDAIRARGNMPHIEKAKGYYKAHCDVYVPCDEETLKEAQEEVGKLYLPIASVYDANKASLIHGDAGAQNFIGWKNNEAWTPENIRLIDLTNFRFGDVMFDLAKLATSHNMLLGTDEWNKSIDTYLKKRAEEIVEVRGVFSRVDVQPETAKQANTAFYSGIIHESWKRTGYMNRLQKTCPQKYDVLVHERPALEYTNDEMGRNMRLAMDYIIKNPGDFTWTEEQIKTIMDFREFAEKDGFIPFKDIAKDIEAQCKEAYAQSS